jgi:hypothetical protein
MSTAIAVRASSGDKRLPPLALALVAVLAVVAVGVAAGGGVIIGVTACMLAVIVLWLLRRTDVAGLLLVGVVPAVSGLRRGLPVAGFRAGEMLIVLLSGLVIVVHALSGRPRVRMRRFEWALVAYACATVSLGALAVARAGSGFDSDTIGALLGPFQYVLMVRAITVALDRTELRRRAFLVVLWSSVPVSVLALLQYGNQLGARPFLESVTASNSFGENAVLFEQRATGPFEHWHVLAGYLLPVLLLALAMLAERTSSVGRRIGIVFVFVVGVAAFTLTLTLAAFVGLFFGGALIAALNDRLGSFMRWGAVCAVVLVIAFGPFLAGRLDDQFAPRGGEARSSLVPATIDYRFEVWDEQYGPALEGRWLTGFGPVPPPEVAWQYTESVYLELLLRGGVILLVVFVGLIITALTTAWRAAMSSDETRAVAGRAAFATAFVMIPMQAVFPYFLGVGVTHVFWALVALAARDDENQAY